MKTKLLACAAIFVGAILPLAAAPDDYYSAPANSNKHVILNMGKRYAIVNRSIPFEIDEDAADDGYKWFFHADKSQKVKISKTDNVQRETDHFDITFLEEGTFQVTFEYANIKNQKDIRRILKIEFVAKKGTVKLEWLADYEEAREKAKTEKKVLLLLFTGSDWSEASKALENNTLKTESFKEFADKKIVLVKLDFPKNKELDSKTKSQNQALKKKFNPGGCPCSVFVDPKNEKQIGVIRGNKENYMDLMKKIVKDN